MLVPAATASKLLGVPGLTDLKPVGDGPRPGVRRTGRNGDVPFAAGDFRRALGLRSTWLTIGVLSLSVTAAVVRGRYERDAERPESRDVKVPTLEQRERRRRLADRAGLALQPDGTFSLAVTPSATTQYRLAPGRSRARSCGRRRPT